MTTIREWERPRWEVVTCPGCGENIGQRADKTYGAHATGCDMIRNAHDRPSVGIYNRETTHWEDCANLYELGWVMASADHDADAVVPCLDEIVDQAGTEVALGYADSLHDLAQGWTPEVPSRYLCKKCGAESPAGIGYVSDADYNHTLSMGVRPDPRCPNLHLFAHDHPRWDELGYTIQARVRVDNDALD